MAGLDLGQNSLDGESVEGQVSLMNPVSPAEASFDLSWEQTPVGALARIMSQREAEEAGGKKMLPGDLNEMFPNIPEKFSEPTTMRVASMIADRHENRRKLQLAIENGPKDFISNTTTFAASLLPHVIDPLNVAAGIATGGLANYFVGARALSTAGKLGLSVTENFVGNMALEPIVFAANKMDQNPYTMAESFANAIAPAVAFPLVGFAGKKLLRAAGLMDPVVGHALHSASIGRMAEGKDPKIGAQLLAKQLARETSGTEFKPYDFRSYDVSIPNDRSFYGGRVASGELSVIGEFLGEATYLSDNANVANGSAARLGAQVAGDVVEFDIAKLKLTDLNNPRVVELVEKLTGEKMGKKNLLDILTAAADSGNDDLYSKFQSGIKEMGFDGITYKLDKYLGEDHPPHNVTAVFSPEKLAEKSKQKSNPAAVPRLSKEEVQGFAKKRLSEDLRDEAFVQDPEGIEQVLKFAETEKIMEEKVTAIKAEAKELMDDLVQMEKGEHLDATELKQLEEIKRLAARQERVPVATAQVLACIRGA